MVKPVEFAEMVASLTRLPFSGNAGKINVAFNCIKNSTLAKISGDSGDI